MSSVYAVKVGESLWDVVQNSTGTLANLDDILSANNFADWTPDLAAGQLLTIPDSVVLDANALLQMQSYPVCNNSVNDAEDQIAALFGILSDNWILATGFWNDNAVWIDTALWID